jgi:3-isopropylmalate dehydrogenase
MRTFQIAVLPGDGIGPEVTDETLKALQAVKDGMPGVRLEYEEFSVGAGEYLRSGNPLPDKTLDRLKEFDAILLGAMGLPHVRWPTGTEMAPQLDLREQLHLYGGERPIYLYHENDTPLRGYRAGEIDFVIVRESTEGLFHSRKETFAKDATLMRDTMQITRKTSEQVCRYAFRLAEKRRRHVTLIDKANVLPSMAFFRMIFDEIAGEFPGVQAERAYVDAASLYLVRRPQDFDVMVTENMFGDILSDLAAGLIGGMGMAPSGDVGDEHAVFQPSHGSAPDIAGQSKANPTAMILSAAMMLEWFEHPETVAAAKRMREAVAKVYADPANRTPDMGGRLTTLELGDKVTAQLRESPVL